MKVKYDSSVMNLSYEIFDDGFEIYQGDRAFPMFSQHEPFIPDPTKSYEDNAKMMCQELCVQAKNPQPSMTQRITDVEANIDYLMLLNDPDSATE